MKRILGALFLALVVALLGTIGVASADPPHDFATGGGKVVTTRSDSTTSEEKFAFSAHHEGDSSSTTEARNGHYVYHQTVTTSDGMILFSFDLKGSVACVQVEGNRASFSGLIEKASSSDPDGPDLVGSFANFDVADNPDQFLFAGISMSPTCGIPLEGNPLTSGNILVNDAQEMP
jgi:hypothetical protein